MTFIIISTGTLVNKAENERSLKAGNVVQVNPDHKPQYRNKSNKPSG